MVGITKKADRITRVLKRRKMSRRTWYTFQKINDRLPLISLNLLSTSTICQHYSFLPQTCEVGIIFRRSAVSSTSIPRCGKSLQRTGSIQLRRRWRRLHEIDIFEDDVLVVYRLSSDKVRYCRPDISMHNARCIPDAILLSMRSQK